MQGDSGLATDINFDHLLQVHRSKRAGMVHPVGEIIDVTHISRTTSSGPEHFFRILLMNQTGTRVIEVGKVSEQQNYAYDLLLLLGDAIKEAEAANSPIMQENIRGGLKFKLDLT